MQTCLKWLLGALGVAVVVTVIAVPLALLTGGKSAAGGGGAAGGARGAAPPRPLQRGGKVLLKVCALGNWAGGAPGKLGRYFVKKVPHLGGGGGRARRG